MDTAAYGSNTSRAYPSDQRPSNPSCFGSLEHVTGSVASVRNRIQEIVARMAGAYPEPANTGGGKGEIRSAPNGLLEQAQANVSSISDNMEVINAALDRLEKSLP
jgi:hypothetical protein